MIFQKVELKDLASPLPDRIIKSIRGKDYEKAIGLTEELRQSRVTLHDFFLESSMILWSRLAEKKGEDILEEMFRYVFKQSAERQLYSIITLQRLYLRFSVMLLAESGWRSHSCFSAGEHPAKFSITEDDEKFTFHMKPCASGARLWLKGWYENSRGGRLSEKAHWWTYNRKGFPVYCVHCSFLNEALPCESAGHLMWPVDDLKDANDVCRWHIYKDVNAIPEKYYHRLNLEKKQMPPLKPKRRKHRYFTDKELAEMARPAPDRIIESINRRDYRKAILICRDVRDEFLFLHDLYVNMIISTLTFISEKCGEPALGEALEYQYEKCAKEQLAKRINLLPIKEKISFLAVNIFGPDSCHSTGMPRSRFKISEDENFIIFTLSPCGSGGRLFRGGAYKKLSSLKKIRETAENRLLIYLARLPLPDSLLQWAFSATGGYYTQRKPHGQGITKKEYSWSFGDKGVPYFCCQCGTAASMLPDGCVEINYPKKKNDPCVWRIKKSCRDAHPRISANKDPSL